VEERPDPVPREGELLVAPIATGICGSDLHLREAMRALEAATPRDQRADLPRFVPGHEFCAEVVEAGPGVDAPFARGDRVTAVPFTHGAMGLETIGLSPTHSGGLAGLCVVDAARTIAVPESVPSRLAALTEPLAVGLHAANLASRSAGPNVVIGCGPVGLAVILALRASGRGPILAADLSPARRKTAEALGADIVIDPAEGSPYERWDDLAFEAELPSPLLAAELDRQPSGANLFECVGAPGLLDQVIKGAPQHSHLVVVGVCTHADPIVPLDAITRELTLEFSFAYRPAEFRAALEMVATHAELAARLITSELALDETARAFDALAGEPEEIKVLIDPRR
jgi:2-desacetyl-2-hydroxyethyl bacteriochlorophyllide A dehydrogenase